MAVSPDVRRPQLITELNADLWHSRIGMLELGVIGWNTEFQSSFKIVEELGIEPFSLTVVRHTDFSAIAFLTKSVFFGSFNDFRVSYFGDKKADCKVQFLLICIEMLYIYIYILLLFAQNSSFLDNFDLKITINIFYQYLSKINKFHLHK